MKRDLFITESYLNRARTNVVPEEDEKESLPLRTRTTHTEPHQGPFTIPITPHAHRGKASEKDELKSSD